MVGSVIHPSTFVITLVSPLRDPSIDRVQGVVNKKGVHLDSLAVIDWECRSFLIHLVEVSTQQEPPYQTYQVDQVSSDLEH
jgi:hypothetical protein